MMSLFRSKSLHSKLSKFTKKKKVTLKKLTGHLERNATVPQ